MFVGLLEGRFIVLLDTYFMCFYVTTFLCFYIYIFICLYIYWFIVLAVSSVFYGGEKAEAEGREGVKWGRRSSFQGMWGGI